MLNDITVGQYFPGKSTLHSMDARLKLVLLFCYVLGLFIMDSNICYGLNTLLAGPAVMAKILSCPEFQNPLTGLNFMGTGDPGHPIGAKLIRCAAAPAGAIIGLDKNYALEMVTAGDVTVEYDRLIDKQLERAAITSISGFAKLYKDASKVLSI